MIPKPVRDRIVLRKYQEGATVEQVMNAAGIKCPNTIYKVLRANAIPLRRPRGGDTLDSLVGLVSYLLFDEGLTPAAVAEELSKPLELIQRVIEERM